MAKRARRNHSRTFMAKVVLATLKGEKALADLARLFDVHPNQITAWKTQLAVGAAELFGSGSASRAVAPPVHLEALHAKLASLHWRTISWPVRSAKPAC